MLRVHPVPGNRQRLDGGAMFGNAPRALWSRWYPPDEQGRVELATRAVLVEDAGRKVLLETGIGTFFPPKLRERYGVLEAEPALLRSLARLGFTDSDIDVVVLSHLHFDHAGGLLAPHEEGAPLRLLFPKALLVVSRTALERARAPHPRDRASFIEGLPDLLERSGRLHAVDPGVGAISVLGERFSVRETSGHTPGLLHVTVTGSAGSLFYCSDLVPGAPWVNPAITMGYDRFPERLVDEKTEILRELAERRTWLAFVHDPRTAFARIVPADRGGYRPDTPRPDDAPALDLDAPS